MTMKISMEFEIFTSRLGSRGTIGHGGFFPLRHTVPAQTKAKAAENIFCRLFDLKLEAASILSSGLQF